MNIESPARRIGSNSAAPVRRSSSYALHICAFVGALVLLTLLASCSEPASEEGWGVGSEDKVCGQPDESLHVSEIAEFEDCTVYLGSLRTSGRAEGEVYALPPLRAIEGLLSARACPPEHRSLGDFDYLERIGGNLKIQYCGGLEDLSGLSRLGHVEGNVSLTANNSSPHNDGNTFRNLKGLEGLRTIGGELGIRENLDLESLDGLDNLKSVGDVNISRNDLLTSLSGLSNLEQIGGKLSVFVNPMLTSFDWLENVTTLGELYISNNQGLHSLEGLSGLRRVRGDVQITNNENLPQYEIDALLARIQVDGEVILD